jgi:hypothetical protein
MHPKDAARTASVHLVRYSNASAAHILPWHHPTPAPTLLVCLGLPYRSVPYSLEPYPLSPTPYPCTPPASARQVIDELESTLPRWLMRPAWYPHFVHVLKVSPRSTYEINLNSVWSGVSNLQNSLMNAQQVGRDACRAVAVRAVRTCTDESGWDAWEVEMGCPQGT